MFKKIGLVALLSLLLTISLKAQLSSKANFFGGMTYQMIGLREVGAPTPNYLGPFYGLGFGMDYVLVHSNDQISLGINPNIDLSVQLQPSAFGVFVTTPTYLLCRVGAGATPFNEQKFGIGLGIGGSYSFTYQSYYPLKLGFLNSGAVAELAFKSYLFRVNWSLQKPTKRIDVSNTSFLASVSVFGLSIFYNF
jgi:hypothetical protein